MTLKDKILIKLKMARSIHSMTNHTEAIRNKILTAKATQNNKIMGKMHLSGVGKETRKKGINENC